MNSAFGVDHGYITKGFKKLHPKLVASLKGADEPSKSHTMDQRIRHNYAMFRGRAGELADKKLKSGYRGWPDNPTTGEWRAMARTQVEAAGARSKRKGRTLP